MGLFSSKKIVSVSSVVYNLAGDEKDRPNFLKTTVVGAVFGDQSIGDTINDSYKSGPGIRMRNFARWADGKSGYNDYIGQVSGSLAFGDSLDPVALASILPHGSDEMVTVNSADIGLTDASWWAEDWILKNDPSRINDAWSADPAGGDIIITWPDGSLSSFTPENFTQAGTYLYAAYTTNSGTRKADVVPGDTITLGANEDYPSTTGWKQNSSSTVPTAAVLTTTKTTEVSYSDGRPTETSKSTSTAPVNYSETSAEWEITVYEGTTQDTNGTVSKSTRKVQYQNQTGSVVAGDPTVSTVTDTIEGGVTRTTTVTTVAEKIQLTRQYRIDTQAITNSTSPLKIFIYLYGSGNAALDAMFARPANMGEFYPFIPFRLDNHQINEKDDPAAYALVKKAFQRSTGGKWDDVSKSILDNKNIGDIDYTYAVFGVALNVQEDASKRYIFKFLQMLMTSGAGGGDAYAAYQTQYAQAYAAQQQYKAWLAAQGDKTNPLYGTAQPRLYAYPSLPEQKVTIRAGGKMNVNFQISWSAIATDSGAGVRPGHKRGELWWEIGDTHEYDIAVNNGSGGANSTISVDHVTLYWQVDDNNWKSISISGFKHKNTIYDGKSVDISAKDAINDSDESGFIIPLHTELYKQMSLVDATQMSTASCFLVFNCYQVKKKKWYQTGIFTIVIIVIAIVIAVVSYGSASGASAAMISAAAATGAAIGLTGLAAIVVGAIVNALAAMIITKLIGMASVAIFGPKIGPLIGAVVAVVAIAVGGSMMSGGTMAEGFSSLSSAPSLLALTNAVGTGINGYIAASTQDVIKKTQDMQSEYNEKEKDVQQKYNDMFGSDSKGVLDPMQFTDSTFGSDFMNHTFEPADSFLGRTLMTGSDIAQMSFDLLENFCELTLSLDLSGDTYNG